MHFSGSHQSDSALLLLPAELRLIILRLLLCNGPIVSKSQFAAEEYEKSIQRSAQILRTCRLLHHEGTSVLYRENTLAIKFKRPWDSDDWYCHILDMFAWLPFQITEIEDYPELTRYLDAKLLKGRFGWKSASEDDKRFRDNYDIFARFQRYCVDVPTRSVENILVACRLLRRLLSGKDVVLKILPWKASPFELAYMPRPPPCTEENMLVWAQAARCLRCASIDFEGISNDKTQELVATITSSRAIYDTWKDWVETYWVLDDKLTLVSGYEIDLPDQNWDKLKKLEQLAASYDVQAYLTERSMVLKSAAERMNAALKAKKDEILAEATENAREVEETRGGLQETIDKRIDSNLQFL